MIDRLETCRVYRATIPLSFLQISDLCTVPIRFSESLNEKNQMCELYNPVTHSDMYVRIYRMDSIRTGIVKLLYSAIFNRENIDGFGTTS